MPLTTRLATVDDVDAIAPLFADYRVFYAQPHDLPRALAFLRARLSADESLVLMAEDDAAATPLGFAQLYPMFCSVAAARTFVLYDLFVAPAARRRGVGKALLRAAADTGRQRGAIRLELETMPDNLQAQSLYRAAGWRLYHDTLRFHLALNHGD